MTNRGPRGTRDLSEYVTVNKVNESANRMSVVRLFQTVGTEND